MSESPWAKISKDDRYTLSKRTVGFVYNAGYAAGARESLGGISNDVSSSIVRLALEEADHLAHTNSDDAENLRDAVIAWDHGLARTIPPALKEFAKMASKTSDPEWGEYQRLLKKFGADYEHR